MIMMMVMMMMTMIIMMVMMMRIMMMVMMMMCSGWRGVVEGKLREKTLCVGGGASFQ